MQMKPGFLILIFMLISNPLLQAQDSKKQLTPEPYDSLLATRLGADPYGMKKYVFAFLKTGPNRSRDSLERATLQKAHLKNIMRLAEEGKLVLAGPFLDDQPLRGIYIFDVGTLEEARSLVETDPAVKAGSLVMELHPWYGSAALVEALKLHKRIEKVSVAD